MSRRFKLSEELSDGQHWTVCDTVDQMVDAIKEWAANRDDYSIGEGFQVEIVEMSQKEVDALPLL